MYSADNTAYDLSLFDERMKSKSTARHNNVLRMATIRKARIQRRSAALNITVVTIIAVFLSLQIFSFTELNEVSNDLNKVKKQYEDVQNDGKRLSLDAEKKIDLANIENIAENQYFMQKAENYQIEYISLLGKDHSVVSDNKDVVAKLKNMAGGLYRRLDAMFEYLR
ncbi:MAG: hypothetical protein Q8865_04325 [Bacillota bacterium]|nr:hypothetical protein [Bacillota bacterium]